MTPRSIVACVVVFAATLMPFSRAADAPAPQQDARAALRKAVAFFRNEVATEGGCLWQYSADLARREGEGKAGPKTIWVQPPGTPTVGLALLRAHELTGEASCLDGAVAAARALVQGQLHSGGWTYRVEFDPAQRTRHAFRVDGKPRSKKARDHSTLDDNTTQAALFLLMRVDQALEFKDASIHEAAAYALEALRHYQFGCGAWSQAFDPGVDPKSCPAKSASLPDAWPKQYPGHCQYWYRPTLNDNLMADVIRILFEAAEIYGDKRYEAAALRGGAFLLLAQLPEPQPGWAQQYNYDMQPMWARKFEPPSVTGGESKNVLMTLMDLYERTGDRKWLEPIPRALAYYKRSRSPGGKLARFYELRTNKPLYFTRDYKLTHDDSDMPTHYAFKIDDWTASIERRFAKVKRAAPRPRTRVRREAPKLSSGMERRALAVAAALDERGAWVEEGKLRYHGEADPTTRVIRSTTFARNVETLAEYLGAKRAR